MTNRSRRGYRMSKHPISALVLIGALSISFNAADAEADPESPEHAMFQKTWSFWLGGFFPDVQSEIRFDSNLGSPGDGVDLEDTFGLEDSKTVLWGGARWRFNPRHVVELELYNLDRTGTVAATTEELDIGNSTIQGGARIDSEFRLTVARLTYGYTLFRRPKHDIAVKAGFHLANTKVGIRARGDIVNVDTGQTLCNPSPCQAEVESNDFTIPLPHLGLSYSFGMTPKLALRSQLVFFALEINDIKGVLGELDLDLHYQAWEYVGLGLGLRYFKLDVEDKGNSFLRGKFEFDFWGPVVYIMGSF
jgi:hypothetical protein